jgi:hypothetical protein
MKYVSRLASRLFAAALCTAAAGACSGFDPEGDTPLEPLEVYREWWAKTEACSGRKADFDRIRWSVVEGRSFPCESGQCVGHWESSHHIWIAREWMTNEMVVRHEMLHDLLDKPGHPNPPFGADCPLTWESWQNGAAGLKLQQID